MNLSVIILCGGHGSRIAPVLGRLPKILAPIGRHSFLEYLLAWISHSLRSANYSVILSTCIGHQQIQHHVSLNSIECTLSREERPLGTLGAVIDVIEKKDLKGDILVLNGDTLFEVDFSKVFSSYANENSAPMLLVKPALDTFGYGGYTRSKKGIIRFTAINPQYISLGAFFCRCSDIVSFKGQIHSETEQIMMLDSDFLDLSSINICRLPRDVHFIDIGIPSDYERAQQFIPLHFPL